MAVAEPSAKFVSGIAVGAFGLFAAQVVLAKLAEHRRSRVKVAAHQLFVGIDLGGTTIGVGLVDGAGTMPWGPPRSIPLGSDHAPNVICCKMRDMVEAELRDAGLTIANLTGVGVCTPGLLDVKTGIVTSAANLKGWTNVPLTKILATTLGVDPTKVCLEQDGNAALLAELWVGAAKGQKNVVMLTLGTGVGGAIFCDGNLLRGAQGGAGEFGHTILMPDGRCHGSSGVKGIFEGYASATAVVQRAKEGAKVRSSSLSELPNISCFDVFDQAGKGDSYSQSVVSETARTLAIGCINCTRCVDPEMILFTGGMAQAGEQLFKEVREQFAKYHWNVSSMSVHLALAACGNSAGVIGAACAAHRAICLEVC